MIEIRILFFLLQTGHDFCRVCIYLASLFPSANDRNIPCLIPFNVDDCGHRDVVGPPRLQQDLVQLHQLPGPPGPPVPERHVHPQHHRYIEHHSYIYCTISVQFCDRDIRKYFNRPQIIVTARNSANVTYFCWNWHINFAGEPGYGISLNLRGIRNFIFRWLRKLSQTISLKFRRKCNSEPNWWAIYCTCSWLYWTKKTSIQQISILAWPCVRAGLVDMYEYVWCINVWLKFVFITFKSKLCLRWEIGRGSPWETH